MVGQPRTSRRRRPSSRRARRLRGGLAQVGDDLLDIVERDQVAEPLLGPEDGQEPALVVRGVGAPHRVLAGPRRHGGANRRGSSSGSRRPRATWERGSQTRSASHAPRGALAEAWPRRVVAIRPAGHAIALRQRREDRLVQPAAQDLDLPALHQGAQVRATNAGWLGAQPLQQRPGVVQPDADLGMPLERLDHRLVGLLEDLLEDPAEVADRLVVVERQRERDPRRHQDVTSALRIER